MRHLVNAPDMVCDPLSHRQRLTFQPTMFAAEVGAGLISRTLIVHGLDLLGKSISQRPLQRIERNGLDLLAQSLGVGVIAIT